MTITTEDIGREIWDTTDTEYHHGNIIVIDIYGRIICEFDFSKDDVIYVDEKDILFELPIPKLQ